MNEATEKKPYHDSASKYCSTRITFTNESDSDVESKTKNDSDVKNGQAMNLAKNDYPSNGTSTGIVSDAEPRRDRAAVSKTDKKRTWETMTVEDSFTDDEWMDFMYEQFVDENFI